MLPKEKGGCWQRTEDGFWAGVSLGTHWRIVREDEVVVVIYIYGKMVSATVAWR